jgi:hypothetical protein
MRRAIAPIASLTRLGVVPECAWYITFLRNLYDR